MKGREKEKIVNKKEKKTEGKVKVAVSPLIKYR